MLQVPKGTICQKCCKKE